MFLLAVLYKFPINANAQEIAAYSEIKKNTVAYVNRIFQKNLP